MWKLFLFLCMGVAVFLLVSCRPVDKNTLSTKKTYENEGKVCLTIRDSTIEEAFVSPEGCFSSSCTDRLEQSASFKVFQVSKQLVFQSHFVVGLRGMKGELACTADCGGAGEIKFHLTHGMEAGVYSVWLGQKKIGEVLIPAALSINNLYCLSSQATGTPVTIPSKTPTRNLTSYPYPMEIPNTISYPYPMETPTITLTPIPQ